MKTIEDIKQELRRRIEELQAHCDEHPRSVMLHHSQQLKSDRALLTAIEALETQQGYNMYMDRALQTIREQWGE